MLPSLVVRYYCTYYSLWAAGRSISQPADSSESAETASWDIQPEYPIPDENFDCYHYRYFEHCAVLLEEGVKLLWPLVQSNQVLQSMSGENDCCGRWWWSEHGCYLYYYFPHFVHMTFVSHIAPYPEVIASYASVRPGVIPSYESHCAYNPVSCHLAILLRLLMMLLLLLVIYSYSSFRYCYYSLIPPFWADQDGVVVLVDPLFLDHP